jgi:hypothetical protein
MPRLKSGAYGVILDEVPVARAEIFALPPTSRFAAKSETSLRDDAP